MFILLLLLAGRNVRMERLVFAMGRETQLVFMFSLSWSARKIEESVPSPWTPPALFCRDGEMSQHLEGHQDKDM